MLQRLTILWTVLLAAAGLALLAALALAGADLYRAARTGPRWKRRLLSAALAVLSAVGIVAAGPEADAAPRLEIMCYKPAMIGPRDQMAAVRAQLGALDKQLHVGKLNPVVLRQAMANLENVAKRLGPAAGDGSQAKLRARVEREIAAARARLEVGVKPLAQSPQWKRLDKTCSAAAQAAGRHGKPRPLDKEAAKALLADLDARKRDLAGLAGARLITQAECHLLTRELSRLAAGVRVAPIQEVLAMSDDPNATPSNPAHDSLLRLIDRASVLRAMAEGPKFHRPAVEKILPPIEADLKILASAKLTARLSPDERRTAATVSKAVRAAVDKIKSRGKSPPSDLAAS